MTSVTLTIEGLGHVPSFKNSKLLTRGRTITKPEYQAWMERAVRSIVSALRSEFQTRGIEITMGPSALSSIACLLPLDDSRQWIPEHSVTTQCVSPGQEGAVVKIERIR